MFFVVTSIVTVPPAMLFVGLCSGAGADIFVIVPLVVYGTIGFIEFCVGCIPGLRIGRLNSLSLKRKRSKKELSTPDA